MTWKLTICVLQQEALNVDRSGDLVHQNLYLLKQSRSNENDNYRTLSLARHTDSTQTQDTLAEIPANYSVLSGNYSVLSGKYLYWAENILY